MLIKITDNFYQIKDALSDELIAETLNRFKNKDNWKKLPNYGYDRMECNISLSDTLSNKIYNETTSIISNITNIKLYQNSPQLWYDTSGYINKVHKDISENLQVNIQIYLNDDDDENCGTYCEDGGWHSVPFKFNTGYVLINPTKIEHGMKFPVKKERLSLYQSYRTTETAKGDW